MDAVPRAARDSAHEHVLVAHHHRRIEFQLRAVEALVHRQQVFEPQAVAAQDTLATEQVDAEAEVETWPKVTRRRRSVAVGPPQRGVELFADISDRAARA